jgi:hypothetical protein
LEDKRYEILSERSGDSHEKEDAWALLYDSRAGVWVIEHTWRYANPLNGEIASKGKRRHSIETFEATPTGKRLEGRLCAALRRASEDASDLECDKRSEHPLGPIQSPRR